MKPDNIDKVVIQLNRPALERLLGNDTELELQLRQQIVEEVTKKHLKGLLTSEYVNKLAADLRPIITQEMKDYVGSLNWDYKGSGGYVANITAKVKEIIELAVQQETKAAVGVLRDKIAEELEEQARDRITRYEIGLMGLVTQKVLEALEKIDKGLDARMDEAFEERVTREISRRLKVAQEMSS